MRWKADARDCVLKMFSFWEVTVPGYSTHIIPSGRFLTFHQQFHSIGSPCYTGITTLNQDVAHCVLGSTGLYACICDIYGWELLFHMKHIHHISINNMPVLCCVSSRYKSMIFPSLLQGLPRKELNWVYQDKKGINWLLAKRTVLQGTSMSYATECSSEFCSHNQQPWAPEVAPKGYYVGWKTTGPYLQAWAHKVSYSGQVDYC